MKKYCVFILLVLALFPGCDSRKDYYKDINKAPELKIKKSGTDNMVLVLKDSIKLRNQFYSLDYAIIDEQKDLQPVLFAKTNIDHADIDQTHNTIKIYPKSAGTSKLILTVSDSYTLTTDTVDLTVFLNLPPVADVLIVKTMIHSPYEVNISAAASYDRDVSFGGRLVNYEYKINDYTVNVTENNINYIFPVTGNYTIKIRVQDDDQAWSDYKTTVYTVN